MTSHLRDGSRGTAATAGTARSAIAMCSALSHGGIAHYTYALAEALEAAGVDCPVLMYDQPEYDLVGYPHAHRVVSSLRLASTPRTRLTSSAANLLGVLGGVSGRPIMHFQWSLGPRNDRLVWPALRALGKRIVYTAHDVLPHEPDIMPREHCAWVYRHADALIVHGEQLKALMADTFGVPDSKIHVVPHGNYNFVADTPGPWDRERARASLGIAADERTVLFFGLIREYKGLDLLIDACRLVYQRGLRDGQRLRLLIAGRSFKNYWEEAGFESRIRDAGLTDAVSIHLQHIPMLEIARFFNAADVLATPYRRGSQSGVLQLAYSFGKASVATRVGSLAEGPTGRITRFVEPNDPEALAEALSALLSDPAAAAQLGSAGRAYADDDLGWGPIAARTRAIYQSLL